MNKPNTQLASCETTHTTDVLRAHIAALETEVYAWRKEVEGSASGATLVTIKNLTNERNQLKAACEIALATIERLETKHGPFSSVQGTKDVINAALQKAGAK